MNYYKLLPILVVSIVLFSCKKKSETTSPTVESITESVYASGLIKSKNQYQANAIVNGIIAEIYVTEGQQVKKGTPILRISNDIQRLNKENSQLAAAFTDYEANKGKLRDAEMLLELSKNKMHMDSSLFFRQKALWEQQIGSKNELEQRELIYQNSKAAYFSAKVKLEDLNRQLAFASIQAKKNLLISQTMEGDYILKSEIDGTVYDLLKSKGEIVTTQTPLAIIGDSKNFIIELQVDQNDILKIKPGQKVVASIDSYKDQTFEATIDEIYPIMNNKTQSFTVNASFYKQPVLLYPNLSSEANIIIQTKANALLIPRNFTINDQQIINSNGDTITIKTGLKDYQKIEILSGITSTDILVKPQ